MALKKKIFVGFGLMVLLLAAGAGALLYALTSDLEVNIARNANSTEAQEAMRKLKLLNEAQAAKKPGFIRLNEAEINGFLQSRYGKPEKNRTNGPTQLVKAAVLLHQNDLTFITWQRVSVLGFELPVVWQRVVSPQRTSDGWRLSLDEMRVGKIGIPGDYWADVNRFLGGADRTFEDRKVWLSNVPTVMLSHNEITRAPELRLYSYVPVMKSETDPLPSSDPVTSSAKSSTNTLAARLSH